MARVVFYAVAYRGDIFPFVPVARELVRRGHDVSCVVPAEMHGLFADEPFECRDADAGELTPSGLDAHGAYTARWGRAFSGAMLLRLYLHRLTVPRLPALFRAVDDALEGADLLVSHPASSLVGRIAAERRGLPWVVGDLFPMLTATETHPPQGFPLPAGTNGITRALNRAAWKFGRSAAAAWLSDERAFGEFRARYGLTTERGYALFGRLSPHLDLVLVSPRYYPPCPDWPDHYRMVGFTPWTASQPELHGEVEEYLAAGEPPVLVTLGTSAAAGDGAAFRRAADALDTLGVRGLFLTSRPPGEVGLADRPGAWPYVPLEPLLPRCRAVVHSGAHGTSALVLTAALPSVVVPHLFDQEWHARRQAELGTGIFLRRKRGMARALEAVLNDDSHARAAREFAAGLALEDGPRAAADAIDEFLAR